jgi:hypothetical protein
MAENVFKAEQQDKNMTLEDAEEQVNRTLFKSVSSTIRHFKNHSFARLLRGEDFFWGQSPAKDEALTIILRYFFIRCTLALKNLTNLQ